MKIFITGATGFIGSSLVQRLADSGHELRCLVRKSSNTKLLEKVGAKLVEGDLSDRNALQDGMKSCDWVIDIAAAYEFWMPQKDIYERVNIDGTRNVMECALECKVSKAVHVSSVAVFGKPEQTPFNEESPVGPVRFSRYAQSKYEGDLIAWDLYEKKGLPLVVIYPGAVLGSADPKTTGQYILQLINRQLPAVIFPHVIFPFVHVKDVAEAIYQAAVKGENVGEKYIVVCENLTFGEINQMTSEIAHVSLPKLALPGFMATLMSHFLTALSDLTKKPPLWGMSVDQIRTMKAGGAADGSKTHRELGIAYTPIRSAIEEAIASYRELESGQFIKSLR